MPTYSAASGEADIYLSNCEMLTAAGVKLPLFEETTRGGVAVMDCPRVVIDPSFGVTVADWKVSKSTLVGMYSYRKLVGKEVNRHLRAPCLRGAMVGPWVTLPSSQNDTCSTRKHSPPSLASPLVVHLLATQLTPNLPLGRPSCPSQAPSTSLPGARSSYGATSPGLPSRRSISKAPTPQLTP